MINNFFVRAYPENNQLRIVLDGYFMPSEMELALQLARYESDKLQSGFSVIIDTRNLRTSFDEKELYVKKIKKILTVLGCGNLKFAGRKYAFRQSLYENVGFYSIENE